MSSNVRVFLRRPRRCGIGEDAPEVVIARGHGILAVLRESDCVGARLIRLVHAPASQVASRAEWLSALAATPQEHEIIDAIVAYRGAGDYGIADGAVPPRHTAPAMVPAAAQALSPA